MKLAIILSLMIRNSMTSSLPGRNNHLIPSRISSQFQNQVKDIARISATVAVGFQATSLSSYASSSPGPNTASSSSTSSNTIGPSLPNPKDRFTTIGNNMPCCRLLNGMWQVSGAHGFEPNNEKVVADMAHYADEGFTTFDLADIYGPAEDFVGAFRKGPIASATAKNCQYFTKWVPRPDVITKKAANDAIERSLKRMRTDSLDLLQFHWWDYNSRYYFDAMAHLMDMQQNEVIKNIGLTNFDTNHLIKLINEEAPIVSNQVSFSILDTRPLELMIPACNEKNVKLLCYGSLLGGFLSSSWKGKSEPSVNSLTNVSLRKYLPWIYYWGGWGLFQELLTVLEFIGSKHHVSISNVALRWVIDQQAVGGAIVGARLGYKEHIKDNEKVFNLLLDQEDYDMIASIQKKSTSLMTVFGDCGDEYRKRPNVANG